MQEAMPFPLHFPQNSDQNFPSFHWKHRSAQIFFSHPSYPEKADQGLPYALQSAHSASHEYYGPFHNLHPLPVYPR